MATRRRHGSTIHISGKAKDYFYVIDGKTYYVAGWIEVEYDIEDHGIGPYEAWGQRGVDSRIGPADVTVVGVDVEEMISVVPNEKGFPEKALSDDEIKAIMPDLVTAMNEHPDLGPYLDQALYDEGF